MKVLVIFMFDNFNIIFNFLILDFGDRIVLLIYFFGDSFRRKMGVVKLEFEFTIYVKEDVMKSRIQIIFQQLNGEIIIGYVLLWIMENFFLKIFNLRKYKVIFVVLVGENRERKEFLTKMVLRVKC